MFTTHCFQNPVNYIRASELSLCERVHISNVAPTPRGFIVDLYCLADEDRTQGWLALMSGISVNVAMQRVDMNMLIYYLLVYTD